MDFTGNCVFRPAWIFVFFHGIKQLSIHFEDDYMNNNDFEDFCLAYTTTLLSVSDMILNCIDNILYKLSDYNSVAVPLQTPMA